MHPATYRLTQLFALLFWLGLAWFILTKCTGCASVPTMTNVPLPQATNGHALESAQAYAAQIHGAKIFFGQGVSMKPAYSAGAVVVVAPESYSTLRRGLAVVYRRQNGLVVCHVVSGWCLRGYIVQGLNNDKWDSECVTPKNYLGIAVAVYN
jgi:hypothetical protein